MKRRVLCILICLVLCRSLLPTAAMAANEDTGLTRAQLAVQLYETFRPSSGDRETGFTDLDGCSEAEKTAIRTLASSGLINGYTPYVEFRPEGTLSRLEAVVLLWRVSGADTGAPEQTLFSNIPHQLAAAFNDCVAKGILNETDAQDGIFALSAAATVQLLDTWLARISDTPAPADTDDTALSRAQAARKLYTQYQAQVDAKADPQRTADFSDVESCSEAELAAIHALYAAGLIDGYKMAPFGPNDPVTRMAAAVLIWRAAGSGTNAPEQTLFSDIMPQVASAFNQLVALGILTPADAANGAFRPNDPVTQADIDRWFGKFSTRLQIALYLYNWYRPPVADNASSTFTDIGNCTEAEQTAINALAAAGIVNGMNNATFAPGGFVTRAQIALILYNRSGNGAVCAPQTVFNDVSQDSWYKNAINWLVAMGILTREDALSGRNYAPDCAATTAFIQNLTHRVDLKTVLEQAAAQESSASDIRAAAQGLDTQALQESMLAGTGENGMVDAVSRLEEKITDLGATQVAVAETLTQTFAQSAIQVVGAKLNDVVQDASAVTLQVAAPKDADLAVPRNYSEAAAVRFSMTLDGVDTPDALEVPVRVTLPVPESIRPEELVVLHYAEGRETPAVISGSALLLEQDAAGDKTCVSFVLDGFSDFIMTREGADNALQVTSPYENDCTVTLDTADKNVVLTVSWKPEREKTTLCAWIAQYEGDQMVSIRALDRTETGDSVTFTGAVPDGGCKLFVMDSRWVPVIAVKDLA